MEEKIKKNENLEKDEYIEDIKPEEIFKYCENIKIGDIIEGKIIEISSEGIYVDIGSKTDGFIPIEEFTNRNILNSFKPRQIIKVALVKTDYNNVHILSYKKAKEKELKETLEKSFQNKTPIEGYIISRIDFGVIIDIGIDAILPYSEMTKELKNKFETKNFLEGSVVKVVIKEFKQKEGDLKIIVSNKLYEEIVKQQLKEKLLNHIKEGDEVIGEVKTLTNFGAFVEIDGVETLLHISDIAWYKLKNPSELLHSGDKIKVKVLKIDKETGKISVGLKQLFPNPWDEIEKKYKVGETLKGKILNITNFGIFVELEPGIEGLVHISEVTWNEKFPNLQKLFKLQQEIQVKLLNIDKSEKKISLSIKKVNKNPWEDLKNEFPVGSKNKGKITKIMPYGLFVLMKPGFEGLIHKENISWIRTINNLKEEFKIGEHIEYIVLDIIPEQERAILSIKHLFDNPFDKYRVDKITKCRIKKILKNMLIVTINGEVEGIIHKKEAITDEKDYAKDLKSLYRPGQDIEAVIIASDESLHKIELSVKKLEKVIQKQLINKFSNIEKPRLKDILSENTENE